MDTGDEQVLQNARVGYQVAVNLWIHQGQVTWQGFRAMLLANSIVLAAAAFIDQRPFVVAAPTLGIVLCVMWLALVMRGFEVHEYRVKSAREIEEKYLAPVVQTVSRGAEVHHGKEVALMLGGRQEKLRLSPVARMLRGKWQAVIVVVAFGLFHCIYLVALLVG